MKNTNAADFSWLQSPQIGPDARRILAEVTFPEARDRTHIDTAAAGARSDANHDVVLEPKPGRRIGCFDPPLSRHCSDNLPAKVAGGSQRPLERCICRFGKRGRPNVWIRHALLSCGSLSLIFNRVGRAL